MAGRSWFLLAKLAPRSVFQGQESEPDFHLIEPTCGSRSEVELNPASVLAQPVPVPLVRPVSVENHVDLFVDRQFGPSSPWSGGPLLCLLEP